MHLDNGNNLNKSTMMEVPSIVPASNKCSQCPTSGILLLCAFWMDFPELQRPGSSRKSRDHGSNGTDQRQLVYKTQIPLRLTVEHTPTAFPASPQNCAVTAHCGRQLMTHSVVAASQLLVSWSPIFHPGNNLHLNLVSFWKIPNR